MIKVYPSILGIDMKNFNYIFNIINSFECYQRLHFDVMDGKYVSNVSFSPSILTQTKAYTDREIDVHLMTYDLEKNINDYINAGASGIIFHKEALENSNGILNIFEYIKNKNVRVGLAINPDEKIVDYYEYLKYLDMVLVMSVVPGKGGQAFIEDSLEKIKGLDIYRNQNNYKYEIIVDGGINDFIANKCLIYGADSFVVGSFIFKNDIKEALSRFE